MMRAVFICSLVLGALVLALVAAALADDGMSDCQQTHSFDVCADALF